MNFNLGGTEKIKQYSNEVSDNPLVSICVQTYNHQNYIKECLESILMQKTTFDFEILLGEDDSNDKTREMCIEYAEKYPNKIRLFLHDRSNVIYISGSATGRYNLIYNLCQAKGKYIALCEGDDYWTDPYKLQKQVNFLEENEEYVGCSALHNTIDKRKIYTNKHIQQKNTFTHEDISISNRFITLTVMIKNINIPFNHMLNSPIGDWLIWYFYSLHGKFFVFNEVFGVYRMHEGGVFSLNSKKEQLLKTMLTQNIIYKFENNNNVKRNIKNMQINRIENYILLVKYNFLDLKFYKYSFYILKLSFFYYLIKFNISKILKK